MRVPALAAVALLVAVMNANGQLGYKERREATDIFYSTLYLRTDVPTNRSVDPFLEISPGGFSWEKSVAKDQAKKRSVYWPFRPNDWVKWGKPTYHRDTIEVWFQGERDELKVTFVGIRTLSDFKQAFDRVFSRVPLQDEYKDAPETLRKAIADRQLTEGMTTQQASCVVGTPLKVERTKQAAGDVVIWYPRQTTGDPRRGRATTTGLPAKVTFVNDRLTAMEK